jgi:hypothetical protein
MGNLDRAIRTFVIAPAAVVVGLWVGAGTIGGILLLAVAAIMLATSAVAFCPLYALLGLDTRPRATRGEARSAA